MKGKERQHSQQSQKGRGGARVSLLLATLLSPQPPKQLQLRGWQASAAPPPSLLEHAAAEPPGLPAGAAPKSGFSSKCRKCCPRATVWIRNLELYIPWPGSDLTVSACMLQ
uniref:Uncharacterized protein n=1 Tax=Chelydra serpentina TaxID=8475 RepID=A0A8C3RSE3_CHESE